MGNEEKCYEWVPSVQNESVPIIDARKIMVGLAIGIVLGLLILGILMLSLGIPVDAI